MLCSGNIFKIVENVIILHNCCLTKERCAESSFRALIYFHRTSLLLNVTFVCNNDLICNFNRLILVMCDKDTGDTEFFNHVFQPCPKFLSNFCINSGKWFIQKQKLRIRRQRPCKSNPLSLTTGQLARISFFQSFKADQFYQLRYSFFDISFVSFLYFQAKCYIVINSHITKQRVALEYKTDAALTCRNVIYYFSVDDDLSAVRLFQSGNHTQDRCFSASTWS